MLQGQPQGVRLPGGQGADFQQHGGIRRRNGPVQARNQVPQGVSGIGTRPGQARPLWPRSLHSTTMSVAYSLPHGIVTVPNSTRAPG